MCSVQSAVKKHFWILVLRFREAMRFRLLADNEFQVKIFKIFMLPLFFLAVVWILALYINIVRDVQCSLFTWNWNECEHETKWWFTLEMMTNRMEMSLRAKGSKRLHTFSLRVLFSFSSLFLSVPSAWCIEFIARGRPIH